MQTWLIKTKGGRHDKCYFLPLSIGASQLVFRFKFDKCVVPKLLHRRFQIAVVNPRNGPLPNTSRADIPIHVRKWQRLFGPGGFDMFSKDAGYYRQFPFCPTSEV